MIANEPKKRRGRGRPRTVGVVRRTMLNLSADDVRRVDAYRAHVEKLLPGPAGRISEPQLLAQILHLGLKAFEQREADASQPELPLETTTTKP